MSNAIVVLNAGSSSIKFSVFVLDDDSLQPVARGQIEALHSQPHFVVRDPTGALVREQDWPAGTGLGHEGALSVLMEYLQETLREHRLVGVGHRVVHGGVEFASPVAVTPEILARLEALIPLAPLHQPHNLLAIRSLLERFPELPQVACFDTSFHRTIPEIAQMFALPHALHESGVRRYGFHGLSYEFIASQLAAHDERAAQGRTIVMHLGNGSSMCALRAGRSVATTMGFTAVDGLPMGTRTGSLDPGVLLYLLTELEYDAGALEKLLYHDSGLLGVSGISSDLRTLLASDDGRAKQAVELLVYRIRRELGSLPAALGGVDALVFTGGIGENATELRAAVLRDAAWLGADLDPFSNERHGPRITRPTAPLQAWVIPTNEELMIARHTHSVLRA